MTSNRLTSRALARKSANIQIHYMACSNDPTDLEWLCKTRKSKTAEAFLKGELSVPGFTNNLPETMEASTAVERPHLNVLTFGPSNDKGVPQTLKLPEAISRQWLNHPIYGKQFQDWVDQFYQDFSPTTDPSGPPNRHVGWCGEEG